MFINEPRLSDFKQVLIREGVQAEFVGGVLVCNNLVAVRRVSVCFISPASRVRGGGAPFSRALGSTYLTYSSLHFSRQTKSNLIKECFGV